MDPDSRRKLNLQEVLKYAVEHTDPKISDSSQNPPEETDTERNEFLQNALQSMTMDVTGDLKNALAILESDATDMDQKLQSLEIVRDHIDDIDLANSFVKMGGTNPLLRFIKESETKLKLNAMFTVAEMAQNNPFCQNTFLQEKFLSHLVPYMTDADTDIGRTSIYAVSSLIRNFNPGINEFVQLNGINTLISCLKSTNAHVYIKAAFLIASLSSEEKSVRELFIKQHAVPLLLDNIKYSVDYDAKQETSLAALSELSVDGKWNLSKNKRLESERILYSIKRNNMTPDHCPDNVYNATLILQNQFAPLQQTS